jgi:uncharacterized protein YigA (DUF484 family)
MTDAHRVADASPASEAEEIKAWLRAHPDRLRDDAALLRDLGLRLDAANLVDFGPVALSRVTAAHRRESSERRRLESVSRANFIAQVQTHDAVLDLLESVDGADLARRIDAMAKARFGLAAGVIAAEGPAPTPEGWRLLAPGQVDLIFPRPGGALMGPAPRTLGLFGRAGVDIGSVAVVRLRFATSGRGGALAFGAHDPNGFTPDMGDDLVCFLARVVERVGAPWL